MTLRPRPVQQALDTARAEQVTTGWQRRYARRAGVESTIALATKVTDVRRARYRGLPKTRLDHNVKADQLDYGSSVIIGWSRGSSSILTDHGASVGVHPVMLGVWAGSGRIPVTRAGRERWFCSIDGG
ncbi:transposase, partial [Micromonospora sp. CB01531]|uniref:transposase n=1 Tax=Micromonospora sp. CB01531 TaxID=1718947 RepID=UPI0018E9DE58